MIVSKMYPRAQQLITGELETTDRIDSITSPLANMAEPYYMGYALYNEYPKCFNINSIDYTVDQPIMTISHVKENHSWGFLAYDYNSTEPFVEPLLYYYDANDDIQKQGTGNHSAYNEDNARFINRAILAKLTYPEDIQIKIRFMIIRNDCYDFDGNGSNFDNTQHLVTNLYDDQTVLLHLNYAQIKSMVEDNTPIYTVNITVNGTTINTELKYSDFNEYNMIVKEYDSNYSVVAIISGYYIRSYSKYYGYTGDSGVLPVVPFFSTSIPQNNDNVPEQENAIICSPANDETYLTVTTRQGAWGACPIASVAVTNGFNLCQGCFPYEYFDTSDSVNQIIHNPDGGPDYGMGTYRSGIYKKMIYIKATGGTAYTITFNFYPQNDLADIYKAACFLNKTEIGEDDFTNVTASNTYTSAHSTAIFKSTNEPDWTRKNEIYSTLEPSLRLWQKIDIQQIINEYDPADLPPYGPTPGGDEFGDLYGNCGPNFGSAGSVTNFVTPWVLSGSQLADFGSHLWTDLLDFDAQGQPIAGGLWQNAKIAVDTYFATGSFDPASVMDFILSVRYFPIDLQKIDYSTQFSVPAVYFGTGRVGVDVTTQPWIANNLGVFISGGSFDLAAWGHKYHDWRDVGNAQAEIYIPFCGTYSLPWTEVKDKTLELSYHLDLISGAITVYIEVTNGASRDLVAVGSGLAGFEVPITATSANRLNAAILSDLGGMSGLIADPNQITAAVTGGLAGSSSAGMADSINDDDISAEEITGIKPTLTNALGPTANPLWGLQMAKAAAPIALGISQRPGVSATVMPGGRGWGALCGKRIPFIKVHKGRYPEDPKYGHTLGHPVFQSKSISSCSGYTQCMQVDTSGLPCTSVERNMIKSILESGFYA